MLDTIAKNSNEIVSFDSESLILVDENDQIIGHENKAICHEGQGMLHRAFSLFIFNDKKELLLQQRSDQKRLWPLYWSNSCCSHPREGESMDEAVHRRLFQELGMKAELQHVYKFQYQAQFDKTGAEHELCSVYIGKSNDAPETNINEIAAVRLIAFDDLEKEMDEHPDRFTPWFKMEWARLNEEFKTQLEELLNR